MNWLEEWFETGKKLLLGPKEFYRKVEKDRNLGYLVKFGVTSSVIGILLTFLIKLVFSLNITGMAIGFILLFAVVGGLIGGSLGLLINAGILHIFVYLLGGEDYNKTLNVVTYPMAFSAFFGWIPVVGSIAAGVYGMYAQIRGLEEFQDFSTTKAAAAVLIPVAISLSLAVILIMSIPEATTQDLTPTAGLSGGNFPMNSLL